MASRHRSLDTATSGPKGHVASIVLTELSTFDTKTPSNSREAVCCPRRYAFVQAFHCFHSNALVCHEGAWLQGLSYVLE